MMASLSGASFTGFDKYSSIPAAAQRSRSPGIALVFKVAECLSGSSHSG